MEMKGQAFVLTSVIFAIILLLVTVNMSSVVFTSEEDITNRFFNNALEQTSEAMNRGVQEDSLDAVEQEVYIYKSLVERKSLERNIDYGSVSLIVFPDRGELLVINYQSKPEEISVDKNGEQSVYNLEEKQSQRDSFDSDKDEFNIALENSDVSREFKAYNPTIFTYKVMEADREVWVNDIVR